MFDTLRSQNDTIQRQVEKVSELTNRLVNESLNSERLKIALEDAAGNYMKAYMVKTNWFAWFKYKYSLKVILNPYH